ncbi:putative phosphoadenosine phosphosulfate reductase [Robertmurraya siralis]|uniref:Adenosine 5'-phosphosulfate reductase n=1 Tax=Robertmurraya siralis TaxID=77777 RepID=A0A919WHP0_9BACI|nr:phosphoadenosine phosphosulfate reductase [Bacillus sp. 7504-2]GIN61944.1 putative phosphoadenosine phosphosulfate reductase [Robertmurraya siralis]
MSALLTYDNWSNPIFDERSDYLEVLKWAYQEYGDEIVYACSFGAEGIVLIDLIHKVNKKGKITFLDTGLHFNETYGLIEKVKKRYPSLQIEILQPELSLNQQAELHGEELWTHNPNLCCHIRKVLPLQIALKEAKAWISGLRRDQSPTRSNTQYINKDEKFKKIKICPLIHWTWDDVITYIKLNNLPYNPLHDQGYASIGCAPCTQPGSFRDGRWAGQTKTECGLHVAAKE